MGYEAFPARASSNIYYHLLFVKRYGLHQSLIDHGVGALLESGDIGAVDRASLFQI